MYTTSGDTRRHSHASMQSSPSVKSVSMVSLAGKRSQRKSVVPGHSDDGGHLAVCFLGSACPFSPKNIYNTNLTGWWWWR